MVFQITDDTRTRHTIPIPVVGDGIVFTGVGDLFAALFLAHSTTKSQLSEALEYTIATLQAVLKNTVHRIPIGELNKKIGNGLSLQLRNILKYSSILSL